MAIESSESAETWGQGKPRDALVAFAARCALRAVPGLGEAEFGTLDKIALPVLRATLSSGVSAVKRTRETTKAVDAAALPAADASVTARTGGASTAVFAAAAADNAADCAAGPGPRSAAHAANASASAVSSETWREVTADAELLDELEIPSSIFESNLWRAGNLPDAITSNYINLVNYFAVASSTWGFWERWYAGMLNGKPLPWDLQEQVALIPEGEWEKGPARIAEVIRGIEAEFYGLDQEALRGHADTLVAQPELYRDAATSIGNLIEREIARFKAEAPSNSLPVGFGMFENLPPIYSAISVLLSSPDPNEREETVTSLQGEINRLHAVINSLRDELRKAQDQLRDARLTSVEAAQMRTFGERLQTTLTNVTLVGSLGMNPMLFLGIDGDRVRYKELKNSLDEVTRLMIEARQTPEVNLPEPIANGPKFLKP